MRLHLFYLCYIFVSGDVVVCADTLIATRVMASSYRTRTSLVRYDLNLTFECHKFYYLALLPVLDLIYLFSEKIQTSYETTDDSDYF
jgi:hypothetical protein